MDNAINRNFEKWDILGTQLFNEPLPVPVSYDAEINRLIDWFIYRIEWLDDEIADLIGSGACDAGDLNQDGGYNVLDIVALANCVLANNCSDLDGGDCASDMNGDGGFNVLDIVALANCVLANNC